MLKRKFCNEKYSMLWQIQLDGRYWADEDGFGMTSDSAACILF
ncbi:MAG: hypothetical protein Q4E24_12610 [bacterium]|nr:hypothetical protein [bacterium]